MHNFISFIGSIIPESVYQYFVNVRVGKVLVFDTLKLFLTIQVILFTYLVISYLINIIFNKELFKKLVVKRLFDGVSVVVIIFILTTQIFINLDYIPGGTIETYERYFSYIFLIPLYLNVFLILIVIMSYFQVGK